MNIRESAPSTQYKFLHGTSRILAQCLADVEAAEKHKTSIYNLDFSFLASTLFSKPEQGAKPFLPNTKEVAAWLLQKHDHEEPFIFAVSGAMYYEFLDQLDHTVHNLSSRPHSINQTNYEQLIKADLLQDSAQLLANLNILTTAGRESAIVEPTKKLIDLIKTGKIHGIGDYLKMPADFDFPLVKRQFDSIVQTQSQLRLAKDRNQGRDNEDSYFHYKMDAANICLSRYFHKDLHSRMLFVTPSIPNLKSCEIDNDLVGRHIFVPLFLKNAQILEKTKYAPSMYDWLKEALIRTEELQKKLTPYLSADDIRLVPPMFLVQINSFYREFYSLLTRTEYFDPMEARHAAQDELREIVSSRTKFREQAEQTIATAKAAAQELQPYEEIFGAHYLEEFGMDTDPIYRRIRKDLLDAKG